MGFQGPCLRVCFTEHGAAAENLRFVQAETDLAAIVPGPTRVRGLADVPLAAARAEPAEPAEPAARPLLYR